MPTTPGATVATIATTRVPVFSVGVPNLERNSLEEPMQ
jgi:hypothetical protein